MNGKLTRPAGGIRRMTDPGTMTAGTGSMETKMDWLSATILNRADISL